MKWLLQNVRSRAKFALANPIYTIEVLLRDMRFADEAFLARITGVPARQIRSYLDEPINTPQFSELLGSAKETFLGLTTESANLFGKRILNQYAAARALAPEHIVETGIANGVSSSYLLLALQKNGRGHLHSIGLSDPNFLPAGKDAGWLVPAWLRERWHPHIGDARELLPAVIADLKNFDIFIHDSLHTHEHMMWEFDTAFPALRQGGLLLADDALQNTAFAEFAAKVDAEDARTLRGVGFLRKGS